MRFRQVLCAAIFCYALSGFAQQPPKTQMPTEQGDCPNAKTTLESVECLSTLAEKTSREVKTKYEQVLNLFKTDAKLRDAFVDAQETWFAYQKKTCDGIWEFWNPGTLKNPAALHCQVMLDRERVRTLDDLYEVPLNH